MANENKASKASIGGKLAMGFGTVVLGNTAGYTVLGGGDSITATEQYGLMDRMGYICTGGGALIRFLTGEELPVVKALRHAAKAFPADHVKNQGGAYGV